VQRIGDEWLSVGNPESLIPTTTSLEPPYPNPFNSTSLISFGLERASDTRLSLYDISGREVRQIIDSNLQAGSYEITFEAENLSAGTYFLRLDTGYLAVTRKMILLK